MTSLISLYPENLVLSVLTLPPPVRGSTSNLTPHELPGLHVSGCPAAWWTRGGFLWTWTGFIGAVLYELTTANCLCADWGAMRSKLTVKVTWWDQRAPSSKLWELQHSNRRPWTQSKLSSDFLVDWIYLKVAEDPGPPAGPSGSPVTTCWEPAQTATALKSFKTCLRWFRREKPAAAQKQAALLAEERFIWKMADSLSIETAAVLGKRELSHISHGRGLIKDAEGARRGNCFNLFVYGEDRGDGHMALCCFIGNIWKTFITICSDRPKWFY